MKNAGRWMKRIAGFFLTALLAFSFSFFLGNLSDTDPVDNSLRSTDPFFEFDAVSYQQKYVARSIVLGYDQPDFYFSWLPWHLLNKDYFGLTIPQRRFFIFWAQKVEGRAEFDRFYNGILQLKENKPGLKEQLIIWEARSVETLLPLLDILTTDTEFKDFIRRMRLDGKSKIPCFQWNGFQNRYHRQLTGIFSSERLYSTYYLMPVSTILSRHLIFTLFISLVSLLLLLSVSFLLVESLSKMKIFWRSFVLGFFDWIYAMPVFWLATLAVIGGSFLYSNKLTWFLGSPGIFIVHPGDTVFKEIYNNLGNLFWPVLVIIINGLAYFVNYIENILRDEKRKMYVQAFLMRGYTEQQVYRTFLRRRVLYSIAALLPAILASLIAGSVVLEVIFNIPGMGNLLYNSVRNADWNMIHVIVVLTAGLVWVGNELSVYLQGKLIPGRND